MHPMALFSKAGFVLVYRSTPIGYVTASTYGSFRTAPALVDRFAIIVVTNFGCAMKFTPGIVTLLGVVRASTMAALATPAGTAAIAR